MTDVDRLKSVIEEIVSAAIERVVVQGSTLVYFAEWLYIVDSASSSGYDLRSTDPRLPDLSQVQLWPGPSGGSAIAAVGSQCRVRFLNADRTKPVIVGLDPNTVVSSLLPASTTVSIGDAAAAALAHAAETNSSFSAISTLIAALSTLTAALAVYAPLGVPAAAALVTACGVLETACTTAEGAISTASATLTTTKALGT